MIEEIENMQVEEDPTVPQAAPTSLGDIERAQRLLASIEQDLRALRQIIGGVGDVSTPSGFINSHQAGYAATPALADDGIPGNFDGERMVYENGKSYQVPPNYASKSKLIEGDPLRLYITSDGKYVYKQLGPVERRTIGGILRLEGSHYVVDSDEGHTYGVLTACVTYYMSLFSLKPGDRVVIMIPAVGQARWAVIDNVG